MPDIGRGWSCMHLNKLSGVGTLKLRVEAEDLIERIKLSIADFSSVQIAVNLNTFPMMNMRS
jgi:hypothetical protein